jgi:hypothetical protein
LKAKEKAMSNYTLNLQDVEAFVQSRKPQESVGVPLSCAHCLAANTLLWKYPEVGGVVVEGNNKLATVYGGGSVVGAEVEIPAEVEEVADLFDMLSYHFVTRERLEELLPELFETLQNQ